MTDRDLHGARLTEGAGRDAEHGAANGRGNGADLLLLENGRPAGNAVRWVPDSDPAAPGSEPRPPADAEAADHAAPPSPEPPAEPDAAMPAGVDGETGPDHDGPDEAGDAPEDDAPSPANGHAAGTEVDGLFAAETAAAFTEEDRLQHRRMAEALLFASAEPLRTGQIAERLPDGADVEAVLAELAEHYAGRGVSLQRVAEGWAFRTAADLAFLMERERVEQRKLSRAALETLAIIAYHQPVTRAEIEDVRGVSVSKGTLDVLMEIGWVKVRGRRQTPGRPVTYGTSDHFLEHFGLERIGDLPGLEELKAAGLLDTRMPTNLSIPRPSEEDGDAPDDEDAEDEAFYTDEIDEEAGDVEEAGAALDEAAEPEAGAAPDEPEATGADAAEEMCGSEPVEAETGAEPGETGDGRFGAEGAGDGGTGSADEVGGGPDRDGGPAEDRDPDGRADG